MIKKFVKPVIPNDNTPSKRFTKSINTIIPYLSKLYKCLFIFQDKNEVAILNPSSGGNGIKLKIASETFICAIIKNMFISVNAKSVGSGRNINIRKTSNDKKAKIILENGPANETAASPNLPPLRFLTFTGTGFAQPIGRISIAITPDKLRCALGSNVSLPIFLAVGSPSFKAINPCAISWNVKENNKTKIYTKKYLKSMPDIKNQSINLLLIIYRSL
jgi:hypothetical protein